MKQLHVLLFPLSHICTRIVSERSSKSTVTAP